MSIKFICSCGKHLRARDEMAARRSMCPRCGRPVGVPSLRPTHAGTAAAPLTPQERLRLNRNKPGRGIDEPEVPTIAIYPSLTQPARPPSSPDNPPAKPKVYRQRRRRQLEHQWHQCLAYPLLNFKSLMGFALILSIGTAGITLTMQNFPSFSLASVNDWFPWVSSVFFVVLIVAYAYCTIECALISALAGEGCAPCLPRWKAPDPMISFVRWLFCFFAGPIVPAGLAVYFCIYGGDLTAVDWGIVAELSVVAVGYWFLCIVSANERNRLRDANPVRVAQLVQRLTYRAIVPLLIAPALGFGHVLLGYFALATLHEKIFVGWLLLACCWGSALFWSAFLFRLLGVWCFRTPYLYEPRP
jgi:hypothetical protein